MPRPPLTPIVSPVTNEASSRGEEGDRGGHLVGLARPPHRGGGDHPLHEALADLAELLGRVHHRRLDRPGRDRVHPHPVAGRLLGERLGEADHARLRWPSRRRQLRADPAGLGGDVHDAARRRAPASRAAPRGSRRSTPRRFTAIRRSHMPSSVLDEEVVLGDAGVVHQHARSGRARTRRPPRRRAPTPSSARRAPRPRPSSSAASSRALSRSRSATATRAPSAASREQVAAPMPPVPPVTSAIVPRASWRGPYPAYGCARVSDSPIPIIGGTGALGFGLALRLAAAGRRW